MKHEKAIKKAASMGIKLTISKESSDKVFFPEKLEMAKKVIAKLKMPLPA